uniref:Uncharacterized protein n=1 Tax=Arundo donax TaxID=35708 RepID=A0A0A8ZES2_ARUDO
MLACLSSPFSNDPLSMGGIHPLIYCQKKKPL